MLPKKKRKLFVLYSIPIKLKERFLRLNLCNKEKLYLVSYSIPLSCMVALLLVGIAIVNPNISDKSYAVEVIEDTDISENEDIIDDENDEDSDLQDKSDSYDIVMTNTDVTPLEDTTSSITFSIGGAGVDETVETSVDTVAYRSHIISISISNADDYYLMISGQPTLTGPSGVVMNSLTDNIIGADIPAGQWGYGWDYTGSQIDAAMIYAAIPTADTKLTAPSLSNSAAFFNGKLNFAAKFPNNATLGKYSSAVSLTLVVTPKSNSTKWRDTNGNETAYDVGTATMQGIDEVKHGEDGGFCKNNTKIGNGWTAELVDTRGENPVTYTIVRLSDGNCWMQENLQLISASSGGMLLTPDDTDIVSRNWTLPRTLTYLSSTNFSSKNTSATESYYSSSTIADDGAYYSYAAAMAGNSYSAPAGGSKDHSSICPKGWELPSDQEYSNMINQGGTSYYKFTKSGVIADGQLSNVGSNGSSWTRSVNSGSYPYFLTILSNKLTTATQGNNRYKGYSVRCIAGF